MWKCEYCDNIHDQTVIICPVCDAPRPYFDYAIKRMVPNEPLYRRPQINPAINNWKCESCTWLNSLQNHYCLKCNTKNPYFGQWSCKNCFIINSKDNIRCDACGADKENENKVPLGNYAPKVEDVKKSMNPLLNKWKCELCNCGNGFENNFCLQCNAKSPYFGKWKCGTCTMVIDNTFDNCTACFQLNPLIKPCSRCHTNVKFNERCKKCDETDLEKIDNLKRKPNLDSWSCSKCLRRNSLNIESCVACNSYGPLHRAWQCHNCASVNSDILENCRSCGKLGHRNNIIAPKSVNITPPEVANLLKPGKLNSDRSVCRGCMSILLRDEIELCHACQRIYFICKIDNCGMIVERSKVQCMKCGAKKDQQGQVKTEPPRPNTNLDLNKWICGECTWSNSFENDRCSECNTKSPHFGQWKCKNCNLMNNNDNFRCTSCGEYKGDVNKLQLSPVMPKVDDVKHPKDLILDNWKCGSCTLLNSFENDHCPACNAKSPYFGKWRCKNCTVISDNTYENCTVCFQLNPLLEPCPRCHTNVKCHKKCKTCEEADRAKVNNNEKKPSRDSWSCFKCSLRNPINIEACTACNNYGPLHNAWQCDNCSFINPNDFENCTACGVLRTIKKVIGIVGNPTPELIIEKIKPNELIKPNDEKALCRRCRSVLPVDEVELCYTCQQEYYICKINDCGMMVELTKDRCTKCGSQKDKNAQLNIDLAPRGWACSWLECGNFNDEKKEVCLKCYCARDVDANKQKCNKCGYINFKFNVCIKCGTAP